MKAICKAAGVFAAQSLVLVACAGQGEPAAMEGAYGGAGAPLTMDAPDLHHGVPATERVLHSLEAAGDRIAILEFTGTDGRTALMIRDEGSAYRPLLIDRLFADGRGPTMLEVFRALSDQNAEPDPVLIQSHGVEAAALGREDDSVRELDIDVDDVQIDKVSPSACTSNLKAGSSAYWQTVTKKDNLQGLTVTCLANNCNYSTTMYTKTQICNASSGTIWQEHSWRFPGGTWQYTGWQAVAPGGSTGWAMAAGGARYYSQNGDSSGGRKYHVRVGEAVLL